MMYFTYVVRPGEAPEGRGPQFEPFWNFLVNFNLRLGCVFQLLAYVGLLSCISLGGKDPLSLLAFLRADPESVGRAPVWAVQVCCAFLILGFLLNMAFQSLADDDGSIKQSRGYRAGSKLLQQGSSIAVFGWVMTLIGFWATNHYPEDPWMKEQLAAGSSWLIFFTGRLLEVAALLLYSCAYFFLETFHFEGAGEGWGWIMSLTYNLTAVAEIIGLTMFGTESFAVVDSVYTVLLGVSLFTSTIWAIMFEPVTHRYDVKLTQSAMRNEYYKSRNAMAYYGPAVVNADGEIDIAAAAEQAQQCLEC